MAEAMGAIDWTYSADINEGDRGKVISRKIHGDEQDILYGIQFESFHIMGESGLRIVKRTNHIEKFSIEDFML